MLDFIDAKRYCIFEGQRNRGKILELFRTFQRAADKNRVARTEFYPSKKDSIVDRQKPKITVWVDNPEDLEGDLIEVELPTNLEVCDRCEGKGVHDHPAFSNGISGEEWNGPDWDDDSRETYMSGGYDVVCSECRGLRVVPVVDRRLAEIKCPEALAQYDAEEKAAQECEAESTAEKRWGA